MVCTCNYVCSGAQTLYKSAASRRVHLVSIVFTAKLHVTAAASAISNSFALLPQRLMLLVLLSVVPLQHNVQAVAALDNMELEMQSRPSLKLWRESQYR
jgi:hypothetical protein